MEPSCWWLYLARCEPVTTEKQGVPWKYEHRTPVIVRSQPAELREIITAVVRKLNAMHFVDTACPLVFDWAEYDAAERDTWSVRLSDRDEVVVDYATANVFAYDPEEGMKEEAGKLTPPWDDANQLYVPRTSDGRPYLNPPDFKVCDPTSPWREEADGVLAYVSCYDRYVFE